MDSDAAAKQFERICQLLCRGSVGPAAPAYLDGFTSKCRVLGSRKHKPQQRVEKPAKERKRNTTRQQSCATPVSSTRPSWFVA